MGQNSPDHGIYLRKQTIQIESSFVLHLLMISALRLPRLRRILQRPRGCDSSKIDRDVKPQPSRSLRAQATWRDCPSVEAVAGRDLVSSTCPRPAQAVHRDHALPRWLGKNNKGRRLKEDYAMVHSVGCVFALSGACKIETGWPLHQDGQADWPRAARRDRAAGRCARTGRLTGHDTAAMGRGNWRAAAPGRAG